MTNRVDLDQPTSEDMDPHYLQGKVIVGLESKKSVCFISLFEIYSKTCLKRPLKNRQNKGLRDNDSLLKVASIAKCSECNIAAVTIDPVQWEHWNSLKLGEHLVPTSDLIVPT